MDNYKDAVVMVLQTEFSKSYEWSMWAVEQVDLAHYWRRCFASELANRIIAAQTCLHLL